MRYWTDWHEGWRTGWRDAKRGAHHPAENPATRGDWQDRESAYRLGYDAAWAVAPR